MRRLVPLLLGFAAAFGLALASGVAPETRRVARLGPDLDWNRVVAALQLVKDEYPELVEAGTTDRLAPLVDLLGGAAEVVDAAGEGYLGYAHRLRDIQRRLRARAAPRVLCEDIRALVDDIALRAALDRRPRRRPDLARGKEAYLRACAACHGEDGQGRPPIAATMNPRPANVLHPARNMSPWEMYNRVTYGGAETAMPSFDGTLPPMDRWDIAFYLAAERWAPCDLEVAPISAEKLALMGDDELRSEFGWRAVPCLRRTYFLRGL